ncbi:hypothetical protein KC878_02975 [Candidatus Saccharibacteria bacterium]|nr:hypothetical protein [Candidatus Saccharibacteria bacterium]MCB9821415.1 hypothetical protein [Candidatus Nomurabacteria bacterium]
MIGFDNHNALQLALPDSPERQAAQAVLDQVHQEEALAHRLMSDMRRADQAFEGLVELPGYAIFEPHSLDDNNLFDRCGEYVFGRILGEPWCVPRQAYPASQYLYNDTRDFLRSKGFTLVDPAKVVPGDIVAYTGEHPIYGHEATLQFGFVLGESRVRSRFGPGPVFEHNLASIPSRWGSSVFFWRKLL